jgi:hypothetical protein
MMVKLIYSFILAMRLDLKWRAIYEIELILKSSAPLAYKICAVRFQGALEHEVEELEIISSQTIGVDAAQILRHQKQYESFKTLLQESCETMTNFWTELLSRTPNGNRLQELGFQISRYGEKITTEFQKMTFGENHRGLRVLEIYGQYLRYVVNEPEEAKRMLDKVLNIRFSLAATRNYAENTRLRNYESVSPAIIVASGDQKLMGTILTVNLEALKSLEFTRTELLGKNLTTIMPKIYGDNHDA